MRSEKDARIETPSGGSLETLATGSHFFRGIISTISATATALPCCSGIMKFDLDSPEVLKAIGAMPSAEDGKNSFAIHEPSDLVTMRRSPGLIA